MPRKKLTYIDLFAGCGGLSLGLHQAGWKGLFAIEKSPDAFKTLQYNLIKKKSHFLWPDWLPESSHDIKKVIKEYKPQLLALKGKVDMVAGGPPCQGFSTAGRRKENDQRNKLIGTYIKFIRIIQPKIIFFENVRGFTLEFKRNKSKGKAYSEYVVNALKRAGYRVQGQMVDFSQYGIPQKRARFILVGIRKDICDAKGIKSNLFFENLENNKEGFLINKGLTVNTNLRQAISDLLYSNGQINVSEEKNFMMGVYAPASSKYQRFMRTGVESNVPDSHRFANHKLATVKKFEYILCNSIKSQNISKQMKLELGSNKHTVIPLDENDTSPTLTTLPDDYIHYCEPRILTVREYCRIQTFPDWYMIRGKYTTGGKERVKEVPRYTQIGNAIPPLFGELSGRVLKSLIK